MAFDAPIHNVVLKVGDTGNRDSDFDTVIDCREPPTIPTATGDTGHADAVLVNFFAHLEIIQCAYAVPCLDAGRCIAATIPPPHFVPIRSVMDTLYLATMHCVNDQAHIAMPRKPGGVVLVGSLVTIADTVFRADGVTTDV